MKKLAATAITVCFAAFAAADAYAQSSRSCRLPYPPYRGCEDCITWSKAGPGAFAEACFLWTRCHTCFSDKFSAKRPADANRRLD